uniref:Glutathione peroxidase n=1 Tax=Cebus imitator TaxID=2715852 RepID=A0A2K5RLR2_CEBIM
MIRQFQASCLVLFFLVSFAQQTLKPEDRKVDCDKNVTGTIYEYGALTLSGEEYIQFKQFAGKPILFVNVATYCSLTAQYPELNALQEELKSLGVIVLGFPCNQFGKQEPGANSEILLGLKTPALRPLIFWAHQTSSSGSPRSMTSAGTLKNFWWGPMESLSCAGSTVFQSAQSSQTSWCT